MPKKLEYNEVSYIKRRGKISFFTKFFVFLVMGFTFVFLLSNVAGNFISLSGFNIFGSPNIITLKKSEMYLVNMDRFTDFNEAERMAGVVGLQGASAFVWEQNDEYIIVGNVYSTESDANAVAENIRSSNPKVFVSKITFEKQKINYKDYTNEQVKTVKNAFSNIDENLSVLYDYILKLDKKEVTSTTVSSHVNNLKSKSIIITSQLDAINSSIMVEQTVNLKNHYVNMTEVLNELVLKMINGEHANQLLKYSYVNLIKLKFDLYNLL